MLQIARTKKIKSLVLPFILLFSHTLQANNSLPEFSAKYSIQKFGIKLAEAHYQLNHTATGYKFTQNTKLHGLASMFSDESVSAVSFVDISGDNLLLTKHRYVQTGKKKNRNEDISIRWNTEKNSIEGDITGVVRGEKIQLTTDTEIWEVLSFQIPLMIEANKDVKEYPYNAILKGKIDSYNFVLTSTKEISFAGRHFQALQMVRTDPNRNRQLHIWLVPELHNIPVIVENYRDGKEHSRMQLESIQFDNDKPLIEKVAENDDDF